MKIAKIDDVELPAGSAVRIVSNSEPIPATNRRIRFESERFLIVPRDQVAMLNFSAPGEPDNTYQWRLMSQSFRWT